MFLNIFIEIMDKKDKWIKPQIHDLGKSEELILGGDDSDPKSNQQPNDFLFEGFAAGTV